MPENGTDGPVEELAHRLTDDRADARAHLAAEDPLADLAAELRERQPGVGGVAIYAVEPDRSLQLVGSAGLPPPMVSAWRRVAAPLTTAAGHAARTGDPLWLPDLAEARRRFVLIGEPEAVWPSRALLPVRGDDRAVAVVTLLWSAPEPLSPATRRAVLAAVDGVAERIAERLRTQPHRAGWIADAQTLLDGLSGALAVLVPIRDDDGAVLDHVIVAASPGAVDITGRQGRELIGSSAAAEYPGVVEGELWQAYAQVLTTGRPREVGPFTYTATSEGVDAEAVYTVRVSRFGGGILISWIRHDEQQRFLTRLAATERLGRLGYGEWDLVTDQIDWSDGLYAIFERDPADGPSTLEEAARFIHPEDAPWVAPALAGFFEGGQPLDVTYRLVLPGGVVKHVQCRFEARRDRAGRVLRAYGLVVDVTEREVAARDKARLADVEAELVERRRSQQVEHRLVTALQQIILPLPAGVLEPPGLQVAVRYQPAEEVSRVGGDWFDVVPLPDDRTLLVVGDVAGHGITAAATMARLRHSIAALAVTSTEPAELLGYLNLLVCDDTAEPTATVVVARFDPVTRAVTWAQAGHPPPVVVAGDDAAALARPNGMIVGARRDSTYESATVELAVGDTLLLYTDGLIERREPYDDDWLGPLLRGLRGAGAQPVDALLSGLRPANPADDTCVLALRPT